MPRFNFTRENRKTGKTENAGYLDMTTNAEKESCSLYFYGDIVSTTWDAWQIEDRCPRDIADFLNQMDGYQNIDIYINSGGGSVFAGLAIYNQLKRYSGHKVGHVDGLAASIASVIMFACDEVHFSTGAQAMIHKPWCYCRGNSDELREIASQLELCEESILDVYMMHTKGEVKREDVKDMMSKETWLGSTDIQKYFDVEVDENPAAVACASDYYKWYSNAPSNLKQEEDEAKEERQRIEREKNEILKDLFMYGI